MMLAAEFPIGPATIWAILISIGAVVGSAIGFFASRRTDKRTAAAQERLVKTLEATIAREMDEKNDYRKRLHDSRDRCQACELEVEKLRSRPDLGELLRFQAQESRRRDEYDEKKANSLKSLADLIDALENRFANFEQQVTQRLELSGEAFRDLVDMLKKTPKKKRAIIK